MSHRPSASTSTVPPRMGLGQRLRAAGRCLLGRPPGAVQSAPAAPQTSPEEAGQQAARLLEPLVRSGAYRAYFDLWQERGFHVTPTSFYEPIPDTRTLPETHWRRPSGLEGIAWNEEEQLRLLHEVFPLFAEEFNQIPHDQPADPYQYYFDNGLFGGTDALVLFCMLRHFRPRRMVEVGSGFSTLLAAQAARRNGRTELVCIEPHPRAFLKAGIPGVAALLEQNVQDVDPDVFRQLGASDVLFIDSSHVAKIGSDVNYLFLEVLPALRPGVVVHIHDIFLPYDYPKHWVLDEHRFWNEQYLLHAFLLYNDAFRILFANRYMGVHHLDAMKRTFPHAPDWYGGSFWMQKKSV